MATTQLEFFGMPSGDDRPIIAFVKSITLKNGRKLIAPPGRAFPIRAPKRPKDNSR